MLAEFIEYYKTVIDPTARFDEVHSSAAFKRSNVWWKLVWHKCFYVSGCSAVVERYFATMTRLADAQATRKKDTTLCAQTQLAHQYEHCFPDVCPRPKIHGTFTRKKAGKADRDDEGEQQPTEVKDPTGLPKDPEKPIVKDGEEEDTAEEIEVEAQHRVQSVAMPELPEMEE